MPHAPPDEYSPRKRLLDRRLIALNGVYKLVRLELPALLHGRLDRLKFERLCIDAFAKLVDTVVRKPVVAQKEVAYGNVEVALCLLSSINTS